MSASPRTVDTVLFDLQPRLLSVQRAVRVTPHLVRVTLVGDDLAGFQTKAPTDHVKLFFPAPGVDLPVMPTLGERGLVPPPAGMPSPTFRDYTVRAFRPDAGELDIDIVLHGTGPAVTWAQAAAPDRLVGVLGPRGSHIVPNNFDWYLLAGDETALPAIGRWVEELPPASRAIILLEVEDRAEQQAFDAVADLSVTWLFRSELPDGTSSALPEAMRALTLPAGDGYIWVAGEAGMLKPIRRYLRQELRHNTDWVEVDGYWKRGVANLDHHAPPDDDEQE